MRILVALSGFHRVDRGAEVALGAVAARLAENGTDSVTVVGSGPPRDQPYRYVQLGAVHRTRFERIPALPILRNEYVWEEATFTASLLRWYRPASFDVTLTGGFPFLNWALRRGPNPPRHVFVTQNGDWPAFSDDSEYRFFRCDGLVCTNPEFFERNATRWRSALIPNGVDTGRFAPGVGDRSRFGLPDGVPVVLMVSALIESKRVLEAIEAAAAVPDVFLVVAGDGPLRARVDALAAQKLPERFRRLTVLPGDMPELYRCADVFLHTTFHESFGNVYIEALATGLPIVAHRSGTLEWILGSEGTLIDTSSPADLIEALESACRQGRTPADEARRHNLAEERFGWDHIAERYRSFLAEVVAATT